MLLHFDPFLATELTMSDEHRGVSKILLIHTSDLEFCVYVCVCVLGWGVFNMEAILSQFSIAPFIFSKFSREH